MSNKNSEKNNNNKNEITQDDQVEKLFVKRGLDNFLTKKTKKQTAYQQAKKLLANTFKEGDILLNVLTKELIIAGGRDIEAIYDELKSVGIQVTERDLYIILSKGLAIEFDPIVQYFDNAMKQHTMDSVTGSIEHLAGYVTEKFDPDFIPENDLEYKNLKSEEEKTELLKKRGKEFFTSMLKKHMIRSVGQARFSETKFVNRFVFVLQQKKEYAGKSTFIKNLKPEGIVGCYTESLDKDEIISLSQNFMINLEELGTFNKKDAEHIKALISTGGSNLRTLFKQTERKFERCASIWASTNRVEFLSGGENTRWVILPITNIDYDYNNSVTGVKQVDIDKCWAEAAHFWDKGHRGDITETEWERLKVLNKDFLSIDDHDHWISDHIKESPSQDENWFATAAMIADYLKSRGIHNASPQKVGQSLLKAGYERVSKRIDNMSVRGYFVATKYSVGIRDYFKADLEAIRAKNETIKSHTNG